MQRKKRVSLSPKTDLVHLELTAGSLTMEWFYGKVEIIYNYALFHEKRVIEAAQPNNL